MDILHFILLGICLFLYVRCDQVQNDAEQDWLMGDGSGGTEFRIAKNVQTKEACMDKCKEAKISDHDINGVTWGVAKGGRDYECFCEKGMTGTDGNAIWQTHFIQVKCGWIRDGGCRQYKVQRIGKASSYNWDESSCRAECKQTKGCGEFFIGKSGGDAAVGCYLYKPGSQKVCTNNRDDDPDRYAMYAVDECKVAMKGATSSSVYGSNRESWGPLLAWKGQSTGNAGYFHSNHEANPWLQIELTKPERLAGVTIINRINCCGDRLRNVQIRAGNEAGLKNGVVGEFKGPGKSGGVYEIAFEKAVTARFISFQIIGKGILQINGLRFKLAPPLKTAGCDESVSSLSEFASDEFKRCDETMLKHKAMCDDPSIKQACPCTCKA